MDSSPLFFGIIVPCKEPFKGRREEPVNESKTIAVDLAKDLFEIAVAHCGTPTPDPYAAEPVLSEITRRRHVTPNAL